MDTYTIIALGIAGYIVYTHYNKSNINAQKTTTYPTVKQVNNLQSNGVVGFPFTSQVMPGPSISFLNSTY